MRKREVYMRQRASLNLAGRAGDSFAALLAKWLDAKRDALRPRTIESYHQTATRYVLSAIGDVPASRLTADDIQRAMAMAVAPRTKNYIRTVCHMALEYGVDHDLVLRNVARKVSPVRTPEVEREMPPQKQWEALLAAIDSRAPCTRSLLLVIAFCGLRVGEACGLKWEDYREGELRIRRAADRDGNLVSVKTKAGKRSVPVPKVVAAALDAWRAKQDALRRKRAAMWRKAEPDLMFTTRYGGGWNQRNVLRAVHAVTKTAGMGAKSVHYLRHVAISHLIADPEMDLKTVQSIAGHSSIRVTLDTYGHLIPGRLKVAAEAMDRRAGGITVPAAASTPPAPSRRRSR
ncbi:MAG TPA: site-specific integrase [Thermoanaerobaculia bacterium]|nr:site-specific integrase [Thermoanaerobaculia bacterium]